MTNAYITPRSRTALLLTALALAVLIAGGYLLWNRTYGSVWTDDAQVDGHVYPLNARVGGTVVWVYPGVDDTKFVRAGTILARLDTRDYNPAVDRLKGDVEATEAELRDAQLAVPITQATSSSKLAAARAAVIEAQDELASAKEGERIAQAEIQQAQASSWRAEADRARYEQLVNSHEISRSEYDARLTEAKVTSAQLAAAHANLQAADEKVAAAEQHIAEREQDVAAAAVAPEVVATARSNIKRTSGELEEAQAQLHDAELNLDYTEIVASVSGIIGRRSIEVGQRVAPGQLLLDIVPTNDIWVTAHFKETQLRHVLPGDPVAIHVDAYGHGLKGWVESIGGATGSKYALIAPDNATGNYVKVVQRVPVRVRLESTQVSGRQLLPGMSVEAKVQ